MFPCGGARVTAPTAVYVTCPCGGRAEVDPSNPELVECELCDNEFAPDPDAFAQAMTAAGYRNDENHGWVEPGEKFWLRCDACYYGWSHTEGPPERRGRWD